VELEFFMGFPMNWETCYLEFPYQLDTSVEPAKHSDWRVLRGRAVESGSQ